MSQLKNLAKAHFKRTGVIEESHHGHSYKIYAYNSTGKLVFIGQITKQALRDLIDGKTSTDICRYVQEPK